MALVRYQPNSLLNQFNNEINRMFLREADGRATPASTGGQWSPAVDVRETDAAFCIETEVPGIDPQAIEVTVDGGVLTLTGERQNSRDDSDSNLRHSERAYGRFVRRFKLPEAADTERVEARAEHGVLTLEIRKKEASQPRRVEVQG